NSASERPTPQRGWFMQPDRTSRRVETATVSRCRVTVLTLELPASSWAAAVGLSPCFPALASVSPSSVGTLWGQPWGQPWTAIYRADEEDSRPFSPAAARHAPLGPSTG